MVKKLLISFLLSNMVYLVISLGSFITLIDIFSLHTTLLLIADRKLELLITYIFFNLTFTTVCMATYDEK